jgi:hypothetical protein
VGPDYVNVVVRPEIRSVMRTVFGQYKPEEIYATQKAIQERVSVVSKTHLSARFVALDDVPMRVSSCPSGSPTPIEAKMGQQQVDQEYVYRLSIAAKESRPQAHRISGHQVYKRHDH